MYKTAIYTHVHADIKH